jgi:hypothetical protein
MLQKIRDIIESKRRLSDEDACFDAQGNLRSTSTSRRSSGSESTMQQMHLEPSHRRQSTCPVIIHIVLDADTSSQEELPKRCSTESLKTLDTESLTCSKDAFRRRSDFTLENSVSSNVYASLSSDKTINVDVFVQALNGMYAKGQIETSLREQFVDKVNNLKVCQEIATSTSFSIAVLYTVAGMLFTIGAIDTGLPGDVVQNIFLTGSCIYFCAGVFGLYQQWKAARCSWRTLQSVVSALQRCTFPETTQSDFSSSCNDDA